MFYQNSVEKLTESDRDNCLMDNSLHGLAGVAPEVNLKNSLHAGDKAHRRGIHPGFETQDRRHQKSKTGALVAPQKGLMSSKKCLKKLSDGNEKI